MSLRDWAQGIRRETHAAWIAARDPRTPWTATIVGIAVTAYAVSPIDLIPDFIPVLGLLDDLILVPLGLWLFVRLVPPEVMAEARAEAEIAASAPVSRGVGMFVILFWLAVLASLGWSLWSYRYW